jgi:tRNA-splicing ligase RtcB
MKVLTKEGSRPIKMWVDGVPVEKGAISQLEGVAALPFIGPHVAVMPDVHVGMGATVGSVIPTIGAIIPAAVGVDIGCGMNAVRTSLTSHDLPGNLSDVRRMIEKFIPHGRTDNGGVNDRGRWKDVPSSIGDVWREDLESSWRIILEKNPKLHGRSGATAEHLGTLGTGNHFIELCLDEEDRVWIMLHSGSRGVGNRIGSYFIEKAKEEMERWFINLPNHDLAYLPEGSQHFSDYVEAVGWAQEYARINRSIMMDGVIDAMKATINKRFFLTDEAVNCHHNYISKENHFGKNYWVTRKGAVSAKKDEPGIIPGSMGTRSYIVRGKGNSDSFCSCSHGAGRRMSRTEASKTFTLADHRAATEGVECRKDKEVIDETPGAYKDIDIVMSAQQDLVEVVHTLKQVLCVKG